MKVPGRNALIVFEDLISAKIDAVQGTVGVDPGESSAISVSFR